MPFAFSVKDDSKSVLVTRSDGRFLQLYDVEAQDLREYMEATNNNPAELNQYLEDRYAIFGTADTSAEQPSVSKHSIATDVLLVLCNSECVDPLPGKLDLETGEVFDISQTEVVTKSYLHEECKLRLGGRVVDVSSNSHGILSVDLPLLASIRAEILGRDQPVSQSDKEALISRFLHLSAEVLALENDEEFQSQLGFSMSTPETMRIATLNIEMNIIRNRLRLVYSCSPSHLQSPSKSTALPIEDLQSTLGTHSQTLFDLPENTTSGLACAAESVHNNNSSNPDSELITPIDDAAYAAFVEQVLEHTFKEYSPLFDALAEMLDSVESVSTAQDDANPILATTNDQFDVIQPSSNVPAES